MKRPNSRTRQRFKRQLAARDGASCFYCRRRFPDLADATLDHLVPSSRGGTWARANLVLACQPCNVAKDNRLPSEFLRPSGFRTGLRPRPTAVLRGYLSSLGTTLANHLRAARDAGTAPTRTNGRRGPSGLPSRLLPALLILSALAFLVGPTVRTNRPPTARSEKG